MVFKHPHKVPIHHGDIAKHIPIKDAPHGRQLRFGAFAALTAPGQARCGRGFPAGSVLLYMETSKGYW